MAKIGEVSIYLSILIISTTSLVCLIRDFLDESMDVLKDDWIINNREED